MDERRAAGRGRHDRLRHGDRQVGREVRHPPLHVKIDGELLPGTENDLKNCIIPDRRRIGCMFSPDATQEMSFMLDCLLLGDIGSKSDL